MRRTERLDHCVAGRGAAFRLQLLLQHRFVIRFRGAQRIGGFELGPERTTNKLRRCLKSAVGEDRARDRFENVREQRVLVPATALLFTASEAQEVAELQTLRGFGEGRRAYETMLHPRELTFSAGRIRVAKIVGDDKTEH